MLIYNRELIRRRQKKIPTPSFFPITAIFAILIFCILLFIQPVVSNIDINIPSLDTEPIEITDEFKYINLKIDNKGNIFVNQNEINFDELLPTINKLYNKKDKNDIKIFIFSDERISYGSIINIINILNKDGYKQISLIGDYIPQE